MWGFRSDEQKERIYAKLDKLEDKLDRKFDRVERRLDDQEKQLAVYNEQLTIHIEGTNALKKHMDKELGPVKDHVSTVKKVFWFISWSFGGVVSVASLVLITLSIMGKL